MNWNVKATGLIVIPFIFQLVFAGFMSYYHVGVTGGIANGTALPQGDWNLITSSISWIGSALSFQLQTNSPILGGIVWVTVVLEFVGVILAIKGGN